MVIIIRYEGGHSETQPEIERCQKPRAQAQGIQCVASIVTALGPW